MRYTIEYPDERDGQVVAPFIFHAKESALANACALGFEREDLTLGARALNADARPPLPPRPRRPRNGARKPKRPSGRQRTSPGERASVGQDQDAPLLSERDKDKNDDAS